MSLLKNFVKRTLDPGGLLSGNKPLSKDSFRSVAAGLVDPAGIGVDKKLGLSYGPKQQVGNAVANGMVDAASKYGATTPYQQPKSTYTPYGSAQGMTMQQFMQQQQAARAAAQQQRMQPQAQAQPRFNSQNMIPQQQQAPSSGGGFDWSSRMPQQGNPQPVIPQNNPQPVQGGQDPQQLARVLANTAGAIGMFR